MRDVFKGMPKSVRVGCFDVELLILDEDACDIAGVLGAAHGVKQRIYLRRGVPPQQTANTFIHEVLHIIHYVYDVTDEADEETFTNLGANGLCAFWQDNPEAVRWWERNLRSQA